MSALNVLQTKDLATRYERALQESEGVTEKCKNRLDFTSEELERVLLQKEGESYKDTGLQNRPSVGGKRAIGKAVAKGGMLLKGKNPGNVSRILLVHWTTLSLRARSKGRKTISGRDYQQRQTSTAKLLRRPRQCDRNILIFNYLGFCGSVCVTPRLV